jgi:hypothetical protein
VQHSAEIRRDLLELTRVDRRVSITRLNEGDFG